MGQHPRILRKRTDWLYAVGAGWREQGNEQRRFGKSREGSRHKHLSTRAGVAPASISGDATDSRHIIARAPGGKYGSAKDSVQFGRVEDNRGVSEPNVISAGALIGCLATRGESSCDRVTLRCENFWCLRAA